MAISDQFACALLMAGEDLANHVDAKNILIEIGIYFQVKVSSKGHRKYSLKFFFFFFRDTPETKLDNLIFLF